MLALIRWLFFNSHTRADAPTLIRQWCRQAGWETDTSCAEMLKFRVEGAQSLSVFFTIDSTLIMFAFCGPLGLPAADISRDMLWDAAICGERLESGRMRLHRVGDDRFVFMLEVRANAATLDCSTFKAHCTSVVDEVERFGAKWGSN